MKVMCKQVLYIVHFFLLFLALNYVATRCSNYTAYELIRVCVCFFKLKIMVSEG